MNANINMNDDNDHYHYHGHHKHQKHRQQHPRSIDEFLDLAYHQTTYSFRTSSSSTTTTTTTTATTTTSITAAATATATQTSTSSTHNPPYTNIFFNYDTPLPPPPPPRRRRRNRFALSFVSNTCHSYFQSSSSFFFFFFRHWRYYIIFIALGIANSGDSSEMGCTSYILSSSNFQRDILSPVSSFSYAMDSSSQRNNINHHDVDTSNNDNNDDDDTVGKRSAMIAGAHVAGMLASGLLAGIVADIRGRRYTLLLGLLNNTVVGIASSMVQTALQLCLLRFMTGVGLGFVIAGVVTLSAEISPPCRRGRYMTLVASCYTLGYLYTSLWAILIFHMGLFLRNNNNDWRIFLFVNAIPTMIAAILVWVYVPESPRFYLCRGRVNEAVQAANYIASRMRYPTCDSQGSSGRGGNSKSSGSSSSSGSDGSDNENELLLLTEEELRRHLFQSKRTIGMMSFRSKEMILQREKKDYSNNIMVDNRNDNMNSDDVGLLESDEDDNDYLLQEIWFSLKTIKQVFVNGHWKTTVPLQLSYLTLTLITGVATWWTRIFQSLELQTDAFALSFYHTLSQIPGVMLASSLIDSVGRRKLVIIGFIGGTAVLLLLSVTTQFIHASHEDESIETRHDSKWYYTWIVLGLANLYTLCLCAGWLAIDCLTAESFPTNVRSTGRGVCVATGRMAGFGIQFFYGPLVNQNRLSYIMGMASVFAAGGILVSCQTTDTTNVDLQDHWNSTASNEPMDSRTTKNSGRILFAETKHGKYLSIEQMPID